MSRQLQFVHIGKCGGSTVNSLLRQSPLIFQRYSSFFESHINGVNPDLGCDYLFCIRNPIDRAFSGFEWRRKLVLIDQIAGQVCRFPGEAEVLSRYGSLGEIARRLYRASDGRLDQAVARDYGLIHHLRESIAFYLEPLLNGVVCPENVFGVVCQEFLQEDCLRILGVAPGELRERSNDSRRSIEHDLDAVAVKNLRRFLVKDYQCLTALWSLGCLSDRRYWNLMRFSDEI